MFCNNTQTLINARGICRTLTAAKRVCNVRCKASATTQQQASYGVFVCSGSPAIAEAVSVSKVDWLCIDAQHGAVSYETLSNILCSTAASSSTCKRIVRVGGPTDRFGMQQALE